MSSVSSIAEQKNQMATLEQILKGNRISYTEIDCSLDENREIRSKYFDISGVKGNYPQVFLQNLDGTEITYVGNFDYVHVSFLKILTESDLHVCSDE